MEAQGCVFQHPTSKRQVTQAPNSVQIHPQLVNGLLVPSLLCAPCSFGCACVGGAQKWAPASVTQDYLLGPPVLVTTRRPSIEILEPEATTTCDLVHLYLV